MKNFCLILLLSAYTMAVNAQSDTASLRSYAQTIQKKYAPDKRSIYFNVQIKGDSVKLESSSAVVLSEFEKSIPQVGSLKISSELLPAGSLGNIKYGIANLSVCNNRSNPQHSAELMTQMLLGTPLEVLKKQGGYYLVKTPDNYLSWTDGGAIQLMDKQQSEAWRKADKLVYVADYGHSFVASNANSQRVSDLVSGNILLLLGQEKGFYKVGYPDGRTAFVPKMQMELYKSWIKRPNPKPADILATAQKLLGVPYLWGGTSIKGVDCSGFTKTAFFLNGVVIPRDASQQALVGEAVDVLENDTISVDKCLKNLHPGDLLFFSAAKRRGINGGRISHTAIYMGNGEFIQSAGMVKISSLIATSTNYDKGQSTTLVGARRILSDIGKPDITRIDQHEWYGRN